MSDYLQKIRGKRVYFDVNVFIYAIEPTQEMLSNRADLSVHPISRKILNTAALLRSEQKIALADAIHVATALNHEADYFITQDKRLQIANGLQKLTLDSLLNT